MRSALNLKGYGFYIIHKSSDVLKSKCHKGHLKLFVVVFDTLIKLCEVTLILHFKLKKKLLSRRVTDICLSDFISCYQPLFCINRTPNSISNYSYTIDIQIVINMRKRRKLICSLVQLYVYLQRYVVVKYREHVHLPELLIYFDGRVI